MTSQSLIDSAVCRRCGQRKPAEAFAPNIILRSGLDSWCDDCKQEYHRNYLAKPRTPSPYTNQITKAFEAGDPINYSRHVCEHIAWYVQRKITEFEATHHKEAPPHMTAILSIAASMTAQHPPRPRHATTNGQRTYELVCKRCGQPFEARSPTARHCDRCRITHRQEQRKQPYLKALRNAQKRRARERAAIELTCQHCGQPFVGHPTRKYCSTDCINSANPKRLVVARVEKNQARGPVSCERCGEAIEYIAGPGRPPKFCPVCRLDRDRELRNESRRRRRGHL